ncbi:MAG: HprK-related kinase A [Pseudomonadota bacterium]
MTTLNVADPDADLSKGITVTLGPFKALVASNQRSFQDTFRSCYGTLPVETAASIPHFQIAVRRRSRFASLWRRQIQFSVDDTYPFEPYPASQGFPMFEWGLNWCIATTAHRFLMLHCAAVERNGRAMLLPAMPGSGKSTLAAFLVAHGWRLLSDEFGIVDHDRGAVLPMPRAIPLKNRSIEVFQERALDMRMGPLYPKTRKGDVCHVFPPASALARQHIEAPPALIVFPRYSASEVFKLRKEPQHVTFTRLTNNAFNYRVCGEAGFRTATSLVQNVPGYDLSYSNIDQAMNEITELFDSVTS